MTENHKHVQIVIVSGQSVNMSHVPAPAASCPHPQQRATPGTGQGALLFTPTPFLHYIPSPATVCERSHMESSEFPSACRRPKAGTAGYFIFNTGQVSSRLPKGMKTSHQPAPSRSSWKGSSPRVLWLLPWPEQAGSPSPVHLNKHPSLSPLQLLEKPHDYSRDPSMALGPAATAGGPLSTPHL